VVALRDRLRRWWNPAQWADDHPTERKQRAQPKKNAPVMPPETLTSSDFVERDFKKPR
jgi:hypothetical protein